MKEIELNNRHKKEFHEIVTNFLCKYRPESRYAAYELERNWLHMGMYDTLETPFAIEVFFRRFIDVRADNTTKRLKKELLPYAEKENLPLEDLLYLAQKDHFLFHRLRKYMLLDVLAILEDKIMGYAFHLYTGEESIESVPESEAFHIHGHPQFDQLSITWAVPE